MVRFARLLLCLMLTVQVVLAQKEPLQIPVRDGVSLQGDLYPAHIEGKASVILIMTPYGKDSFQESRLDRMFSDQAGVRHYHVVIVDWRCGAVQACAQGNNGEDGYDVVEWIAQQSWSDGKVGMYGPSALGNIQYMTAREQPPHLVCCVPEVSSPQTSYDQYYTGGCIHVESLESLNFLFGFANPVAANPHYNFVWQVAENLTMYPEDIGVPMLLIGGWYDHNILQNFRMIDTLRSTSKPEVRDLHKMVVGPWVHGGTGLAFVGSSLQGELEYPGAEAMNTFYATAFFDYHMRGLENGWEDADVFRYFQMGEDVWKSSDVWPPLNQSPTPFYFSSGNTLTTESPQTSGIQSFQYDPQDPSPTVGGKTLNLLLDQGPYDQRSEVESKGDGLIFTTETFEAPMELAGSISLKVFVSSDRKDTDVAVRITDVYPDGRSMLLLDGIQRMRFRNGLTVNDTSFMVPGEIYPVTITLNPIAFTITPGHQLRVVITSSNYPRFNRNMNNGGEIHPNNNFDALVDPLIATNTLHFGGQIPSQISLPLINASTPVQEVEQAFDFEIFPNPSDGMVKIKSEGKIDKVEVLNIDGHQVLSESIDGMAVELNLDSLNAGVYIIRCTTAKGVASRSVILY